MVLRSFTVKLFTRGFTHDPQNVNNKQTQLLQEKQNTKPRFLSFKSELAKVYVVAVRPPLRYTLAKVNLRLQTKVLAMQ